MSQLEDERRPVVAVLGSGTALDPEIEETARAIGRLAIDAGFRLVTGGLGGVMAAASQGARSAKSHMDGDIIGILPGSRADDANPFVDVAIPSGLGLARNTLVVASADVVIAVGGGAGTLNEMALAWQMNKPMVALRHAPGWSAWLADQSLDPRRDDTIMGATDPEQAVQLAWNALATTPGTAVDPQDC